MNIGDEVTINGKIIGSHYNKWLGTLHHVRLNSGIELAVTERDINTIRPKIEIPDKDERRGK